MQFPIRIYSEPLPPLQHLSLYILADLKQLTLIGLGMLCVERISSLAVMVMRYSCQHVRYLFEVRSLLYAFHMPVIWKKRSKMGEKNTIKSTYLERFEASVRGRSSLWYQCLVQRSWSGESEWDPMVLSLDVWIARSEPSVYHSVVDRQTNNV
jgi:hypothetical protein